jgi:hypothetical protein
MKEGFIKPTIPINIIDIMAPATTISVSVEIKEMLRQLGEKGESYDAIIRKLIRRAGWKSLDDRWNAILEHDEFIPLESL